MLTISAFDFALNLGLNFNRSCYFKPAYKLKKYQTKAANSKSEIELFNLKRARLDLRHDVKLKILSWLEFFC